MSSTPTPRSVRDGIRLSLVVPCFNEAEVLPTAHPRFVEVLGDLPGVELELVYVDDGSRDGTRGLLEGFARTDPRVKLVALSRNFGHQRAVTAGCLYATGDVVALIDADLQDPPEALVEMLDRWREGYDVAFGRRRSRAGETGFKLVTAKAFYRVINRLSDVEIPLDTGDFRLMDRRVVDALNAMPERDRFLRGMVAWLGFHQIEVPYDRQRRAAGDTKYPLDRMLGFALDGILSFSTVPLRITTTVGFGVSVLALFGIGYALWMRVHTGAWVAGWALLFMAVSLLGGMQLVALGVIGEYVGRIYREAKGRPLFLVDELVGFEQVAAQPVHHRQHGTRES